MSFPNIFISVKPQIFFLWKDTGLYIRKLASLPSTGPFAQESHLETLTYSRRGSCTWSALCPHKWLNSRSKLRSWKSKPRWNCPHRIQISLLLAGCKGLGMLFISLWLSLFLSRYKLIATPARFQEFGWTRRADWIWRFTWRSDVTEGPDTELPQDTDH